MRKLIIAGIFSLFGIAAAQADIVSTFNADTQGWTVVGDEVGPVTWVSSGGNPGGYVSVTDSVVGGVMYFVAPDAYFGNHSGAYGTALTFDLIQRYPDSPNQFDDDVGDVVLKGSGLYAAGLLEDNGFRVVDAENADAALKLLETRDDVRLLFTDIQMPGSCDGMDLVH